MPNVLKTGSMTILLLGLLLPAADLPAADLSDLYFNGFVSQGWINTSHNNYLVDDSRDGTAEYHEAAVSIQNQLDDRLRVGLQFLARDFGESGNNNVVVDWAYGDYRWRDYLGVRIGKFKTPHGLYGQGRDIDILRPTVLLPQSVYNEAHRSFILGVQGASFYGNIQLERGGGFDYEIYGGAMNIPDPTKGFWHDIFIQVGQEAERTLRAGVGPDTTITFLGVADEEATFDMVYGGGLVWTSPCSRLRLGASYMATSFLMTGRSQFSLGVEGDTPYGIDIFEMPNYFDGDIGRILILSAEYTRDPLTLTTEFYQEKINETTSEGYYIRGALAAPGRWTWSYCFSRYLRDREDYGGANLVEYGLPEFMGWQNDYCLATRLDANEHLTLKAEYHVIDGMGLLSTAKNLWGDPDAYKRWWSFATAKATIHF